MLKLKEESISWLTKGDFLTQAPTWCDNFVAVNLCFTMGVCVFNGVAWGGKPSLWVTIGIWVEHGVKGCPTDSPSLFFFRTWPKTYVYVSLSGEYVSLSRKLDFGIDTLVF